MAFPVGHGAKPEEKKNRIQPYFVSTPLLVFTISSTGRRAESRRQTMCPCHMMRLSETLSYFDGNVQCQLLRACRLHCWLRNVGIRRAALTDSCTAVAFLACHTGAGRAGVTLKRRGGEHFTLRGDDGKIAPCVVAGETLSKN